MKDYFSHHQKEFTESFISDEIRNLNFFSLPEGQAPLDYLLYSPKLERNNAGRVQRYILERYAHTELGGWWCSGIDILSGNAEGSGWGCFKPDNPRMNEEKGKPIKYEHPPKIPTEIFALRITPTIWEKIA
ncbi:MAG: bifunctional DNA primase/helicase, partial [Cyanobacteria bacterium J06641_2]